jgi:ATP-dependent DNA helicase RecG
MAPTPAQVRELIARPESTHIERKRTYCKKGADRLRETICAFANDVDGTGEPGYLLVGVEDDGSLAGLPINDEQIRALSQLQRDGQILPLPQMQVHRVELAPGQAVAVLIVQPADLPPLRVDGRIVVRRGSSNVTATPTDERLLLERQAHGARSWDQWPCAGSSVDDLDRVFFEQEYRPRQLGNEPVSPRPYEDQLASLRLYDLQKRQATHGGLLLCGVDPRRLIDGPVLQYVRFPGLVRTSAALDHQEYQGRVFDQLKVLEKLPGLCAPVRLPDGREVPAYPEQALRELVINAVLHRLYAGAGAAVIQVYAYLDRVEIDNPGGLHHALRMEDFGKMTAYRNMLLAEAMKPFGLVHKFGEGIPKVRQLLEELGSPPAEFWISRPAFGVVVRARQPYSAGYLAQEGAVRAWLNRVEREHLDEALWARRWEVEARLAGTEPAALYAQVEEALLEVLEGKQELVRKRRAEHEELLRQREAQQQAHLQMDEMYRKWQGEHLERQRLEQELARAEQEKQRAEQEKQQLLERIAALEAEVKKGSSG